MKRVVGSSFFAVFLLLLVAAAYFYFQAQKEDRGSVLLAVPSDALFLLTCQPGSGELRQLGKSDFLASKDHQSWESRSSRALIEFDSISNNNEKWGRIFKQSPLYISGHHSGSGEVGVVYYISVSQSQVASIDKLCLSLVNANRQVGVRRFGQSEIHDLKAGDGRSFAWTISGGVFMCTFTPYLLEDALRQQAQEESSSLARLMPDFIREDGGSLNIAVRYSYVASFLKTQLDGDSGRLLKPLARFGEWTILTLEIAKESIVFHGQTLPADSFSFVRLFVSQRPVEWTITGKLPSNTVSCIAWAMDDPADFIQQLNGEGVAGNPEDIRLRDHFKPWVGQELTMIVQRQMSDSVRDQPIAIFRLRNEQACRSYLRLLEGEGSSREESYHGTSIRLVRRPGILKAVFGPVFEPVNRFYYSILDGYLIVANHASALRGYINGIKSGQVLAQEPKFRQAFSKVSEKGNILFYIDLSMYENKASGLLGSKTTSWFPQVASGAHRLGVFLVSLQQSNGIFLTQGVLNHIGHERDSIQVKWSVPADSVVSSPPALLQNIGSRVISADSTGRICLFDDRGRLEWVRELGEPVISTVHTINSAQGNYFLFNTKSHVHLLDAGGDPARNYPLKLASSASSGLTPIKRKGATFDGFVIPCDNMSLREYHDIFNPQSDMRIRRIPARLKSPVVVANNGSILLHHPDGRLSILHKSNAIQPVTDLELLPTGGVSPVGDEHVAGVFVAGADSSLWIFTQTAEVQPYKSRTQEPVMCGIRGDVNADGSSDWILGGLDGIRVETSDGFVLFRYKTGSTVDQLSYYEGDGRAFIGFRSSGTGFLIGRDGLVAKGWPVPGIVKMAFDFTGEQAELSLASRNGEIRQVRIF